MNHCRVLFFSVAMFAAQFQLAAADSSSCNADGELLVGFLRYKCNDKKNKVIPIGCITENGEKIDIGKTITTKWFVLKCEMVDEDVVQMIPEKCMLYENELNPGDRLSYDGFHYQCTKVKSGLVLEVIGCTDDSGNLVEIGKTFTRKDFIYECDTDDGKVIERGVACVVQNIEIPVTKKFRDKDFSYRCSREGENGIKLEAMGCIGAENKIVNAGQEFTSNGFLYRCEKDDTDEGPVLTKHLMGCTDITTDGQESRHTFDTTWEKPLQDPKYKYIMKCIGNKDDAQQVPIKCGIDKEGETLEAEVGCMVKYSEAEVFLCKEEVPSYVEMRLLKFSKAVELSVVAEKYGVNAC